MAAQIAEFSRRSSQKVQLSVDDACRLTPEMETEAVHILQEALTNVRKHARARQVDVMIQRQGGSVELSIRDDGRGFNPYNLNGGSHFGLQIMQERAVRVGGAFYIYTAPGSGTQIVVSFPAETAVPRPILADKRYQ
jgi:two-component system nitrate/nitrite sensor histidine kinase NarX